MARRAIAVVSGGMLLAAAGACGDDTKPASMSAAGSSTDGGQAGKSAGPSSGAGGSQAGASANEGGSGTPPAGGAGDAAGGAPTALGGDVNGQVYGGVWKIGGAVVVVNGVKVTADAEGRFQVPNVAAEYELMIRLPNLKYAFIYEGVKTREPHVNVGNGVPAGERHIATVSGKFVNGFADPEPGGATKVVGFVGTADGFANPDGAFAHDSFQIQPQWVGDTKADGEIWALLFMSDFARGAYGYAGFGRRKISFKDGDILGSVDGDPLTNVTLVDPVEVSMPTHVTAPAGWTSIEDANLLIGPVSPRIELTAGDGFIVVPKLDVPLGIEVSATGDGGSSLVDELVPAKGGLSITHHQPSTLAAPGVHATGISSKTEFFWENAPETAASSLIIQVGDWVIVVSTTASSLKFPDLTPLKVRVPGQIAGTWAVASIGPATTIEEAMAIDDARYRNEVGSRFYSVTDGRDFVTGD